MPANSLNTNRSLEMRVGINAPISVKQRKMQRDLLVLLEVPELTCSNPYFHCKNLLIL